MAAMGIPPPPRRRRRRRRVASIGGAGAESLNLNRLLSAMNSTFDQTLTAGELDALAGAEEAAARRTAEARERARLARRELDAEERLSGWPISR